MRQNHLAQTLGIDQTLLSKVVNGFRTPDEGLRAKIASLLRSDENWLFEDAPASTSSPESVEP
jgi:transcriptional regulator with XRE-family HTH domain